MSPFPPAASLRRLALGALTLAAGSAAQAQMLPGLETEGEAYIASYEFDGGTTTLGVVDLDAVYTLPDMPLFFGVGIDYLYDFDEGVAQFDDYRVAIGYDFGTSRVTGLPNSVTVTTSPCFTRERTLETF